jgi:hypothetical protein
MDTDADGGKDRWDELGWAHCLVSVYFLSAGYF